MNKVHAIQTNKKSKIQYLYQFILVFAQLICLSSCVFGRDYIQLEYEIQKEGEFNTAPIQENICVDIAVYDQRSNQQNLGCQGWGIDQPELGIEIKENLADVISNALRIELMNCNFTIAPGNLLVEVDIKKFTNDFKVTGMFTGQAHSEMILFVQVKNGCGQTVYSQLIMGTGNLEIHMSTGENAKKTLNYALNDAIHQLMADPNFFHSLLK